VVIMDMVLGLYSIDVVSCKFCSRPLKGSKLK
jgi:hypothetical protein